MLVYFIRRLLLIVPTLLIVTVIVFTMIRSVPGDIIDVMLAQQDSATNEVNRELIEHRMGLDSPVYVQYGRWIGIVPQEDGGFHGILQFDLGKSLWTWTPILPEVLQRIPASFELGFIALIMSLLIALPIGIFSAIRQDTIGDYLARSFSIALIALPSFWVATVAIVLPSIWWQTAPAVEFFHFTENPIENIKLYLLPSFILSMGLSGMTMRMIRTMMLEVLKADYIRTAWSKGLRERTVIYKHALKNALIPVVTIVGLQAPVLIAGSVILEQIFNIPGIGRYFLSAIAIRDYTVLSALNLCIASLVLIMNLFVDLAYGYLDPRVQYS